MNIELKKEINKQLTPFLDSLTDEELVVFKAMVKKMRTALVSWDGSAETTVKVD